MNPIARLVRDRLSEKDWTYADVERQGGPPARTVMHLADGSIEWRQTPRPLTLDKLAKGLQLPPARVKQAAMEALGSGKSDVKSRHARDVSSAMAELSPTRQALVSEIVQRIIEGWEAGDAQQ